MATEYALPLSKPPTTLNVSSSFANIINDEESARRRRPVGADVTTMRYCMIFPRGSLGGDQLTPRAVVPIESTRVMVGGPGTKETLEIIVVFVFAAVSPSSSVRIVNSSLLGPIPFVVSPATEMR